MRRVRVLVAALVVVGAVASHGAPVASAVEAPAGGAGAAPSRSSQPAVGGVADSARSSDSRQEVGAITGSVTSGVDGAPVEGVCVSAVGNSAPAFGVTDESGGYVLGGLASGDYTVHFDRCGASSADGEDPGLIVPPSREVTVEAPGVVDGVDARLVEEVNEPVAPSGGSPAASSSGEELPEVGAISGSVVSGVDEKPVVGVCVSAIGDESAPAFGVTDESGRYVLGGLESGEYSVQFNRCGASSEGDDPGLIVPPSRQVTVEAPEAADGVDARLVVATDEPAPPADGLTSASQDGHITGTVTADAGGAPLADICVWAQDLDSGASSFGFTGSDGTYDVGDLSSGSYQVRFYDCFGGGYATEWFDDAYANEAATFVAVTTGQTTSGIDAGLATGGHITGTVTADAGGAPLGGICVYAYDPVNQTYVGSGGATGTDGTYDIGGLGSGSYRMLFDDCSGGEYAREWYDDTSYWAANLVAVTLGQTVSGIDAGLATAGRISGTVTADTGGAPLEGVCVYAQDPNTGGYGYGSTGPSGTYDVGGLRAGSYRVQFSDCSGGDYVTEVFDDTYSGSAVAVTVTGGQTTSGIDAGLAAAGHITGTVTADAGGAPLRNICVDASDYETGGYGRSRTATDGTYEIGGLPTGSYRVTFYDCYGADYVTEVFDDTYSGSAVAVTVTGGQTTSGIDAGLATAGHIAGRVTADAGGAPLGNICVSASAPEGYSYGSDRTGPDGTYDLGGLLTGSYRVQFAECDGDDYLREYFDNTYSYEAATLVAVTGGQTTSGIDAGLATGGHIAGSVTADTGGAPLEDICVYAYDPATSNGALDATGPDGTFDIGGLPAGSYRVQFAECYGGDDYVAEVFDDTYSDWLATLVTVTLGQTTSGIDAGLATAGRIAGMVTADTGGAPLADICVNAYNSDISRSDRTGPDGTYDIGGLPTGSFQVYFWDCSGGDYVGEDFGDTYSYEAATLVAVTVGQTTSGIDAGLAVGGHITGTVIADAGGAPLEGICVSAYDPTTDGEGYGSTGPDGTYDIGRLPTGSYRVRFSDCSGGGHAAEYFDDTYSYEAATLVAVTVGQTTSGIDAGLAAGGHITGTVTADAGGAPLADICVYVEDPDTGAYDSGSTGPDGTYDIGGLLTGSYKLYFYDCSGGGYVAEYFDDTYSYEAATLVAVTLGQTTSGIDAGLAVGGHIAGTVTADVGGAPLADICVYAHDPATDAGRSGYTGPDGTYDIGRLPTGSYQVRFSDCSDGGYLSEYFDDTFSSGSATLVAVSSGQTTSGIDAGLAAGGHIAGTVTDAASGQPVPYAGVAVLRTSDFSLVRGAVADPWGDFWVQVPTGTYYLYLVDGTGGHASGFYGPPTTVTVTAGSFTGANPTMAPTRGTIAGTVTETGTATPLAGVRAITINTATGALERAALSGAGGSYTIGDVPVGSYWVVFLDPTGNHAARYGLSAPTVATASTASVAAGASASLNAALPAQSPPPAGSSITGTVTETGTGTAMSGVVVVALRTSDYGLARTTTTNAAGGYSLDVAPGNYHLAFLDPTGTHTSEWSGNQPISNLAGAATVPAPSTGADAGLASTTGGFSGTVTAQANGAAIPDAWVIAINTNGQITRSTVTAANGSYTLAGLAPGDYRAVVVDPTGTHPVRYYPASIDYAGATAIAVTPANTTTGINLALPSN